MLNGKHQPQHAAQAVRTLFLLVVVLSLAANWICAFAGMTGIGAGQTPAGTRPSRDNVKAQTPAPFTKDIPKEPPQGRPTEEKPPLGAAGANSQKPATSKTLPTAAGGRRDPFKAWVAPDPSRRLGPGGALPAGARGLIISRLRLEGVVHQEPANTMIAVVTNSTNRAYFLRVNDTVYNGVVSKITPEAIYFKENTLDSHGRVATHEVEIKLGSAPGEGR